MIDRGHFRKLAELAVSEIKKEMNSRAWKQHKTVGRPKTYPDALVLIIAVFREILGDGAYNTKALKKYVEEECGAKLISPPKIKAKSNGIKFIGADKEANERCNDVGRGQWKDEIGYHKRSIVETNMFREKSPFGDGLRCRTKENQIAEITIRAMILNIWTNEWMPKYTKP